jgi:cell division transport system permease protein
MNLKMSPHNLEFFMRETFINVRRNGLMSLATVSAVFIGLCILGALSLATVNLNRWSEQLVRQVEIMVPLHDGLTAEQSRAVRLRIEKLPGVRRVQFVSRQQALQRMGLNAESLGFASSPLFDSFDVSVTAPERVTATAAVIQQIRGVDAKNVDYGERFAEEIFALRRTVWLVGGTAVILLALAMLLIVSNTIRLTVFARRREIRLMQLIGATNEFICAPFVLEGAFHGVVGAVAACAALKVVYNTLAGWMPPFFPLADVRWLSAVLFTAGIAFGFAGSAISLRRYFAQV